MPVGVPPSLYSLLSFFLRYGDTAGLCLGVVGVFVGLAEFKKKNLRKAGSASIGNAECSELDVHTVLTAIDNS